MGGSGGGKAENMKERDAPLHLLRRTGIALSRGPMRIRPYRAADQDAVIALWTSCGLVRPANDPELEIAMKLVAGGKWLLVAEASSGLGATKRVVGTVMAGYDGHRGWINYLAVEPKSRGGGIGRALMAEAERKLEAAGCPKINLQVRTENAAVTGFYERLGFSVDAVVSMGKRLEIDAAAVRRAGSLSSIVMWQRHRWLAPVLVVLVGLILRVAHVDRNYGHPDETITVEVVGHMRSSGDWDTNWAKAPGLESSFRYDQYNFSSYIYGTFFFYRAAKWVPGLEAWRARDQGFWVYRMFSALLATVVVAQAWWLARRLAGARAGLAAGALVAVVPLLVQDAHYIRPEAFVTVLTMAAVMLSLPLATKGWANLRLLAASVALGLAIASKVSMLALVWLPLVPVIAAVISERKWAFRRLGVSLGLGAVGVCAGFAMGAPGAVANPGAFWRGIEYLTAQYAGLHPPHSRFEGGFVAPVLGGYFWSVLGAGMIAAGLVGSVGLAARKRWLELTMLAGPVVLFVVYFSTRTVFFERNLSHVVPLFCALTAVGLIEAGNWLARRTGVKAVYLTAGLLALVLYRPAELSSRLVWLEFSGRYAATVAEVDEAIRAAHPGLKWHVEALLNLGPAEALAEHFSQGGGALLLREIDYHDEWCAQFRPLLTQQFKVKLLATVPSIFSDVPGCSLHVYNSWTSRYFLVEGLRKSRSAD